MFLKQCKGYWVAVTGKSITKDRNYFWSWHTASICGQSLNPLALSSLNNIMWAFNKAPSKSPFWDGRERQLQTSPTSTSSAHSSYKSPGLLGSLTINVAATSKGRHYKMVQPGNLPDTWTFQKAPKVFSYQGQDKHAQEFDGMLWIFCTAEILG